MAPSPITSWQIEGEKKWKQWQIFSSWALKSLNGDFSHEIRRQFLLGGNAITNLHCIRKQKQHFTDKGPYSQGYGLSSSHLWMRELDSKEGREQKNWCFQIVLLEKILQSPLDSKVVKPINPKGNQPWIYSLEGLMPKLKLQYFGHLMWRADSLKRPWCWERLKAGGGDNRGWDVWMASLTQWNEFEQTLGDSEGQGSLECCNPWGHKKSDMT